MENEEIIRLVRGATISVPKRYRGRYIKVSFASKEEVTNKIKQERKLLKEQEELMGRLEAISKLKYRDKTR